MCRWQTRRNLREYCVTCSWGTRVIGQCLVNDRPSVLKELRDHPTFIPGPNLGGLDMRLGISGPVKGVRIAGTEYRITDSGAMIEV